MKHRRIIAPAAALAAALLLPACATPDPGSGSAADAPPGFSLGSLAPAVPTGDVIGQGTVIDAGDTVELCLGPILESYPPQCGGGVPLENWSWDGLDGSEEASGKRWGAYAVQGRYDGETLTVTEPPILLALYDPLVPADPAEGKPGTADAATLAEVQEEIDARLGRAVLVSGTEEGRLWVDVVWDDGTWQKAADDDFGQGVVVVRSALREL